MTAAADNSQSRLDIGSLAPFSSPYSIFGSSQTKYKANRLGKGEPFDHLVKLLVLGDSSVGKSSLLLRFAENKFDPNFVLTIGVDFKTKIIESDGRRVKLQVWDTAGQERFRTITPAYFRSAMGVILVYDLTNAESFHNISRWMQNVEDFADPNIVRILVGNKLDMGSQRQISRTRGEDLAREYDIPFFETSAKGSLGVEDAFMCAANMIRCRRFPAGPIENDAEMEQRLSLSTGHNRTQPRRKCCT